MIDKRPIVVVVEKEPSFLKLWEKVFHSCNCEYYLMSDPEVAMAFIKDKSIDLLVSEVVMSKKTGYELAEEVHKRNPNAQIVLTTTYECDLSRFKLDNPRFHILYKPYHKMEDVLHFLEDILHHKDPRTDTTIDEDSWSENDVYPSVMEWKL